MDFHTTDGPTTKARIATAKKEGKLLIGVGLKSESGLGHAGQYVGYFQISDAAACAGAVEKVEVLDDILGEYQRSVCMHD